MNKYTLTPMNVNREQNLLEMGSEWDWDMAGVPTLKGYLSVIDDINGNLFWVYENSQLVGFFDASPHPDFGSLEIGTFIRPQFRGRTINLVLKHSVASAFQTMRLPLIATILETNVRSLTAMRKIFGTTGQAFTEPYRDSKSFLFKLNELQVDMKHVSPEIIGTLTGFESEFQYKHGLLKAKLDFE